MKSVAIGTAVLGLVVVLGSRLPQMGEAVGVVASTSDGSPSATAGVNVNPMLAAFPLARSAERYAHEPRMSGEAVSSEDLTAVVRRYCVVCHNDRLLTGNLSLQVFDVAEAAVHAEVAEKMVRKLRLGMMPPPGMPRPGGDTLATLVGTLEGIIDQAAASTPTAPGTRRFQRLKPRRIRAGNRRSHRAGGGRGAVAPRRPLCAQLRHVVIRSNPRPHDARGLSQRG